jgi:hypothetical protein
LTTERQTNIPYHYSYELSRLPTPHIPNATSPQKPAFSLRSLERELTLLARARSSRAKPHPLPPPLPFTPQSKRVEIPGVSATQGPTDPSKNVFWPSFEEKSPNSPHFIQFKGAMVSHRLRQRPATLTRDYSFVDQAVATPAENIIKKKLSILSIVTHTSKAIQTEPIIQPEHIPVSSPDSPAFPPPGLPVDSTVRSTTPLGHVCPQITISFAPTENCTSPDLECEPSTPTGIDSSLDCAEAERGRSRSRHLPGPSSYYRSVSPPPRRLRNSGITHY